MSSLPRQSGPHRILIQLGEGVLSGFFLFQWFSLFVLKHVEKMIRLISSSSWSQQGGSWSVGISRRLSSGGHAARSNTLCCPVVESSMKFANLRLLAMSWRHQYAFLVFSLTFSEAPQRKFHLPFIQQPPAGDDAASENFYLQITSCFLNLPVRNILLVFNKYKCKDSL